MKLNRLMAAVLTAAMTVFLMAGCGNSEQAPAQTAAPEAAQTEAAKAETKAAGQTEAAVSTSDSRYNVDWEDMAELNMVLMCPRSVPSGLAEVEAAINEITENEINTHVSYNMIEMGNYIQQVTLMMSSGEQVDILLTFPGGAAGFTAMQTQGQLMDITDLLDEYGQAVKDTIGDYIKGTTIEGRIYAVPIMRDYSSGLYITMRTDVLEDLGLVEKAESITSMQEYGEILEAVKNSEKWGHLAGISSATGNGGVLFNGGDFQKLTPDREVIANDMLVSDLLAVDPSGADPQVKFIAEMDEYREIVKMGEEWNAKNLIYKDANTDSTGGPELCRSDKLFSWLQSGEYGFEASSETSTGMDMTVVKLVSKPINTGQLNKMTWAVPNTSKYPEAAVTFLSMMYTDPRINNLMAHGIEGRDYVLDENGVAQYPDGDMNVPYHGASFVTGNQFITLPFGSESPTLREEARAELDKAELSRYIGFTFDTSEIETEMAAINSVMSEFSKTIVSGLSTEKTLDEYIEKMHSVGIDLVIQEAQRQLDEWAAQN